MSLRLQFALLILLAGAPGAGWWFFTANPGAAGSDEAKPRRAAAATPVLTEVVELAPDRITLRLIGTGRAIRSAAIHPKAAGEVVELAFRADEAVKAGQILLRLDSKHQSLKVRLAEVAFKEARRDMRRMERLAPAGHASRARLDTARAGMQAAAIRLEQAEAELADRIVRAPFAGFVGLTETEVGDRVDEAVTIAGIDDRSEILVEFAVPEDQSTRIAVGDRLRVRPWSLPDSWIDGVVAALDSRISPAARSLKARARIPNADGRIRPGSSFEVRLDFTGEAYPRIKEVAVLWSRDGAYLWRVREARAEKVFVRLVRRDHGHVLVDGPLGEGDVIVVEGLQGLRDGQKLKPRAADAAGKTS